VTKLIQKHSIFNQYYISVKLSLCIPQKHRWKWWYNYTRLWVHPHVISSPFPIQSCFTSHLSFFCPFTSQHTDLVNSSLTTTASHSLSPSFSTSTKKENGQAKPSQAKPSRAKVLNGSETCAKRKLTSPSLLAIPAFDHLAGLNNRHLNSNRGITILKSG